MKKFFVSLIVLAFTTSISAQFLSSKPENYAVGAENYIDFIPIAPIQIKSNVTSATSNNQIKTQSALEMSMDKQSVLNFIPNESMETTIQRFNADGTVSYLYSGRSLNRGTYRLIIDYNKYIIQSIEGEGNDSCVGYAKIGVGLRIVANVNALKNNIDISSLVALGKAAADGDISGSVGYEVLGVESKEITAIIPINSEITSSINQVFLQAIGVVKGKIYDADTRLYPQVIAIKHTGCDIKTITKNLIGQYGSSN
tara:strand:- start:2349 stop:3113 length:765 start_codon:yes stop_codon:yes gene_type:complete